MGRLPGQVITQPSRVNMQTRGRGEGIEGCERVKYMNKQIRSHVKLEEPGAVFPEMVFSAPISQKRQLLETGFLHCSSPQESLTPCLGSANIIYSYINSIYVVIEKPVTLLFLNKWLFSPKIRSFHQRQPLIHISSISVHVNTRTAHGCRQILTLINPRQPLTKSEAPRKTLFWSKRMTWVTCITSKFQQDLLFIAK